MTASPTTATTLVFLVSLSRWSNRFGEQGDFVEEENVGYDGRGWVDIEVTEDDLRFYLALAAGVDSEDEIVLA